MKNEALTKEFQVQENISFVLLKLEDRRNPETLKLRWLDKVEKYLGVLAFGG